MADLEEATNIAREAVKATPDDDPDRSLWLNGLGCRLHNNYLRTGAMADLEEAINIAREVVEATPVDDPDRYGWLNILACRLHDNYLRTGAMADLEEATTLSQEAIKAIPDNHPHRPILLNNLGVRLGNKFLRTGAIADLDKAITITREAIKAVLKDDPNRVGILSNLGLRLGERYLRTGAIVDLEEAIIINREALKSKPEGHPNRAIWMSNLGVRLSDRYSRTGAIADLEEAITLARETIKVTPEDHPDRAGRLNHLGVHLGIRYSRTGAIADLKEAIIVAREAVKAIPEDHPDRAIWMSNLGVRLSDRYSRTGAIADLEEAITLARETIKATPEDHPDRAIYLNNIGGRLHDSYLRTGAMADLDEAKVCFKEALNTKLGSTSDRIRAATRFLSLPNIVQDAHGPYVVAKTAVNLVPLLSPFSLQPADKHHQLRQAVGLASDAAAIALDAGQGALAALQLLETGRGVLAGSLQNIRTDLSALQQRHPHLAHAFVLLRDQLDAPSQRSDLESSQPQLTEPASVDSDYRHKASAEMDSLVYNIRGHPGFERFLLSAAEEEMLEAAVHGPVVVINVSPYRCDALIVELSSVRALDLPQLTQDSLEERAGDPGSVETLAWLWDTVVERVLDMLGLTTPPAGDTWPHLWWIPTGPLTRFPLHAAGHHYKQNAETALDRVVSSYSPSIRSIIHTRRQRRLEIRADAGPNVVLVDMPQTPCGSGKVFSILKNVTRETDAIRKVCESVGYCYDQPPAYKRDVLAALENCQILHFAGHGGTRPDPLQSLLLLQDWEKDPLTVESLLETNLSTRTPFLAYLSACGTGRIQDSSSIDESIHLASAFQLAGFRHVIGTLWEVDDELCVYMARLTYEFLGAKGLSDESVSRGLHHATKTLRDNWVERQMRVPRDVELVTNARCEQALWVPYVHFGI